MITMRPILLGAWTQGSQGEPRQMKCAAHNCRARTPGQPGDPQEKHPV